MKKLLSTSIILEWETVQQGGLDRGLKGLREINHQLTECSPYFDRPAEVIICYDPKVISEQGLDSIVQRASEAGAWPCPVILVEVPSTANYYEKKNIGSKLAKNEILVLFDTDLLPDPGWLEGMLSPFQRWDVSVVVGGTYLDHARLYDMAVALFWIFRPAMPASPLHPTNSLLSNNLAIRRGLFLRFLFPDRPTYRGQCTELGLQLLDAGLTMYEQQGARASHPPPPGDKFVLRGLYAGQNEYFYAALRGEVSPGTLATQVRTDYRNLAKRIGERSIVLKSSSKAQALAWMLGSIYYAIKAAAYFGTHLQRRLFKVPAPVQS